jgi:murein DD-endopeptidase MepM/ murein hydrolase activator NlpD
MACVALALLAGTANAQNSRTHAQAERERRAESARAERLRRSADALAREAQALDARLNDIARRARDAERQAAEAEHRFTFAYLEARAQISARERTRNALEAALIAAAFAERDVAPQAARVNVVARAAAAALLRAEREAAAALARARTQEFESAAQAQAFAAALSAAETEQAQVAANLEERRRRRAELASRADQAERRARALAAEARTLRELASRVERERRRGSSSSGGSGGAGVIPATWRAPAEGRVLHAFGARQEAGGPLAQGVTLQTAPGAAITAPAGAEIAFAGPFRSYGHVLILNLDGGYALVLTGLETINVRVGETVAAGQTVGTMASTATPAPELYIEVRHQGRTVDPGRWLSARGLENRPEVRAG